MVLAVPSSGNMPLFFSSTVPAAAPARAAASPRATSGVACRGGSSNNPFTIIARRMRRFIPVMRAV